MFCGVLCVLAALQFFSAVHLVYVDFGAPPAMAGVDAKVVAGALVDAGSNEANPR